MNWPVLLRKDGVGTGSSSAQKLLVLGLSLLIGLIVGALLVFSWGLSSSWQGLIIVAVIAVPFALLAKNLEKIILASIALSAPLNLDISLIVSPYARNPENIAAGHRTLIALTELRVGLVSILLVVGYALWLIRPQGSEHKPIKFFARTTLPALGLIFFSILSMTQAQDLQLSLFRVVQLIELFLTFFYLANHIRTTNEIQFFILVFIGGMLLESSLMIVQWVTSQDFSFAGIEAVISVDGRIGGTFGNPGPAAGYLSSLALIACAIIWAVSRTSHKVFAALSFGLGLVALVSTGSRIGWAAFAMTLSLFFLLGARNGWVKRQSLIALAVVVLALGAMFFNLVYDRYTANDNGSADARPMMYRLAWNVIQAHPWLGVGAGNYALMTRNYYTPDVGDPEQVIDIQVHNAYLGIWAESGVFALLCYLGLLGAAIMNAWSCIRSNQRLISLIGIGTSLAIVSLCIQMFTGTFHLRSITLFVWLLVALAASLRHLEQMQRDLTVMP